MTLQTNSVDSVDSEVLALRQLEQLGRAESAELLGISQEAGAMRYLRALTLLKGVLATMPGRWEGP